MMVVITMAHFCFNGSRKIYDDCWRYGVV